MVIDWSKLGRRYANVLVYGDGADIITYVCTTGAPPPIGPPGGPGAKEVSPARITDVTRLS